MAQNPLKESVKNREYFVIATIAIFILAFTMGVSHVLTSQKEKFHVYQQIIWLNITTEEALNSAHKSYMSYYHESSLKQSTAESTYQETQTSLRNYERLLPLFDEINAAYMNTTIDGQTSPLVQHYKQIKLLSHDLTSQIPNKPKHFSEAEYKEINRIFEKIHLTLKGLTTAALNDKNIMAWRSKGYNLAPENNQLKFLLYLALVIASGLGMAYLLWGKNHQISALRAQFYQAQKMEALGRLAGGIAHDFNNVLAAIMGYTELLIEDLEKMPEQRKFASQISAAGKQAQQLVEQILAYSRHSQTHLENIDIVKEVNDVFSFFQKSANAGVSVTYRCPFEKAIIKGNSNHIHQVLMNICVNANDALGTNKGQIQIEVNYVTTEHPQFSRLYPDRPIKPSTDEYADQKIVRSGRRRTLLIGRIDPEQAHISIKISDNGEGIERDTLEQIFDPFFTTKGNNKGTGLGLSAALGIISEHNGVIIVSTCQNEGTSFEIIFPLTDAQTVEQEQAAAAFSKLSDMNASGTIMLVEDEMTVAMMTCQMLERMGYDTIHCLDGREALEALEDTSQEYHLVITDYKMPHMTGIQLTEEIKKKRPNLPVIMISGYSDEKLQPLIEQTGIKAVLNKPVSKETLAKAVSKAILDK